MELERVDDLIEIDEMVFDEVTDGCNDVQDLSKNASLSFDVPDTRMAIVSGNPEQAARFVDSVQGDEIRGASGTCGLTSISNICRLSGLDVSEGMVTAYAIENGLCEVDPWSPASTGGITGTQAVELFGACGIDAHLEKAESFGIEELAQVIESGRGVMVGVDAGVLWDDPGCSSYTAYGQIYANHYITVTGSARDAATGEVVGFYICDSGRGLQSDACRYISAEKFSLAYNASVYGADAVITNEVVRNV